VLDFLFGPMAYGFMQRGLVAAILSAPIAAYVFGGVTGSGTDLIVAALRQAEFQGYIARTEPLIAGYLQTTLPQPLQTIYVFDRSEWIDTNIRNFRELFEPLERVYGTLMRRVATQSLAPIAGMVNGVAVSAQMGLLLGSLARRVLGQYDVALLGREPLLSGKLYFVEEAIFSSTK